MRLIDLDSLIVEFKKRCRGECCCCTEDCCGSGNDGCGCRVIDEAPTADPIKHGHWINKGFEPIRCSVCGITVDAINGIPWAIKSFKYCPYCGAKMDEVEE